MLPVDSKLLQPGTVAAFIAGSLALILGGAMEPVRGLLTEPGIVLIGLSVAAGLGGGLGLKVVRRPLVEAICIAIAYGALVPMLAAAIIALPVAPLAAAVAVIAWPLTIPTALAWLALIRWDRSRIRLSTIAPAATAVVLSTALLLIRFTQPAATTTAAAGRCLTFPGEDIATIAWSPDGEWLGVGSEGDGIGIVRVIEQGSNTISELARGPFVVARLGVAVGPGGETTYLVDDQGATAAEDGRARLWRASPTYAARPFAELPTPGLADLTWTTDGIAAVQWVDPVTWTETHRLVWVRPNSRAAEALDPIAPDQVLDHPVFALLTDPWPKASITIQTPSGDRVIEWPEEASDGASVTANGAFLVFHVLTYDPDAVDLDDGQVVAQSTNTGQRVVLLEGDASEPKVAAGRLAYLTAAFPQNSVCVKAVTGVGS